MLGMETALSTAPSTLQDLSLLKSHKALPKRRVVSSDAAPIQAATTKLQKHDLEREGYSSSERIRSWIPEPSSIQVVPDCGLPLTPPSIVSERQNGLVQKEYPSNIMDRNLISTRTISSGLSTPVIQRSPPTPETTPPKLDQYTRLSHETSNPRLPSSRAESFETARENQTSDEESGLLESPSLRPSRQQWLRDAGHPMPRNVGLGLGLEQEDGERTPTGLKEEVPSKNEDLISFDDGWNGATPEMEAVKGGADLAYRAELKKNQTKKSRVPDQLLDTPLIINGSIPSPITRSPSLRQRADQTRQTPPRASTENFAEQIQWPWNDDISNLKETLYGLDKKRFSQISATSTIVEAMVYNTPPQRRKTLRHSSKVADLASATAQAKRNSSNLSDRSHRKLLRHSKSPDGGQRASFVSVTGTRSDNITSSRREQDVLPVITIPQQISSLGSRFPCVHTFGKVRTLTLVLQQPLRPTTAPEDAVGYFDVPRMRRRIVSAHIETSPSKEDSNANARKAQSANAPPEVLSSVHTSAHVSRATSNASARAESISPPTRQQSHNDCAVSETPNARISSLDEESNGDWSALRPRSSLVTPFSLRSARSSTPGTLEVNEATAISIYPHTNKSILVVQHAPRRDSQPAGHSAIIASNAKFAIPAGSIQPPVIHQPPQLLDSPRQNPRSPPQPPDFKIIPPTPANAAENPNPNHQDQPLPEQETPSRRLSNRVKRAFSTRRYSEAFVTPLTRSMSLTARRNTVHGGARRASTGIDPDRNLHPFWRPRAFWDDRSDSDSDFGNDGPLVGNSLGMPTDGIKTFNPPKRRGSLIQKFGSLRLSRRRKSESVPRLPDDYYDSHDHNVSDGTRRRGSTRRFNSARGLGLGPRNTRFYRGNRNNLNTSYEFIQRPQHTSLQHGGEIPPEATQHGVPRLGYQVQFVGFKGLAEKVKERREKARREKVRERLRGSIDVLRGV
ncbi:MAG: hypothetical protein Q9209_007728 [Squamulea sp. 1 TL-2023]